VADPVFVNIVARDALGRTVSSDIERIAPQDTDGDGLPDHIEETIGTAIDNPDTDGDELPDGQEVSLGTNPNNADTDGDGMSDEKEISAGSDPLESRWGLVNFENQRFTPYFWYASGTLGWRIDEAAASGRFAARSAPITHNHASIMETTVLSSGGLVSFDAATSSEVSDQLQFFVNGEKVKGIGGEEPYRRYVYPIPAGKVRLRWEYHKDRTINQGKDAAWLDNITIPAAADSDGDGIADGWEFFYFDSLEADLSHDSDGDGLTDVDEGQYGTNPHLSDSDMDGKSDAWEVQHGSAPTVTDTAVVDFETQTFAPYFWGSADSLGWRIDDYAASGSFAARSAPITHNHASIMETTVLAPGGLVSFDAATSSEASDRLRFFINGQNVKNIGGEEPYQHYQFPIPRGKVTLRWEYHKDGSFNQGQDAAWLDNIAIPAAADSDGDGIADGWEFRYFDSLEADLSHDSDGDGLTDADEGQYGTNPHLSDSDMDGKSDAWEVQHGSDPTVTETAVVDFETQTFAPYFWDSADSLGWHIDDRAASGRFAARSAPITHNQTSIMETTVLSPGGLISFDAATSSEASDRLRFFVNGQNVKDISGEKPYQHYQFPIPRGKVTLRWEYHKDGSFSQGQDAAWLDNITIPAAADSDGDGIADGWEFRYFDSLEADLSHDSDGDGLTDAQEGEDGTNPLASMDKSQ
jgi:hypothetical protein